VEGKPETDHPIVKLVGDWNYIFFEGPSRLINDDTGETVGLAVTESRLSV